MNNDLCAKLYQISKPATQSGKANMGRWVLEFYQENLPLVCRPLSWVGTKAPLARKKLFFESQEAAELFAKDHGIPYEVIPTTFSPFQPKSYGKNFQGRLSYL